MFFNRRRREQPVVVQASMYRLTERWWPECFWITLALEAKEKKLTMRQPDEMRALAEELERSYGEVILTDWPWVRDIQKRKQANG